MKKFHPEQNNADGRRHLELEHAAKLGRWHRLALAVVELADCRRLQWSLPLPELTGPRLLVVEARDAETAIESGTTMEGAYLLYRVRTFPP